MKGFITLVFWLTVALGGFWLCISSLLGSPWILALPLAILSPALFIGLAIGSALHDRH